jgi:8-oxo-dGTP pyrophosphatase MutT (NUDIX family)
VENIMNSFLTAVLIFLVVAMPGIVLADGAGVIAYTKIQGETYVLLADHHDSNRGWASFGGRLDGQPARVAALREFHEETRCVYRGTTVVFEEDRSVKTPRFVAYVAEVKFVPAYLFAGIKTMQGCTGPQYQERGPWAWVPASSLRESLARGIQDAAIDKQYLPSGHHGKLWPVDAENLQMAFEQGLIP